MMGILLILMGLMLLIRLIFKTKLTGQINDNGIINVEIMVPLQYQSNFWRTSKYL